MVRFNGGVLRHWRGPAAGVLLALVATELVLSVIGCVLAGRPSLMPALADPLVVAAALAVGSCALWGEPTPGALRLVTIATVLFWAYGLSQLILAGVGLIVGTDRFAMLAMLLLTVLPMFAAAGMSTIRRSRSTMSRSIGQRSQADQFGHVKSTEHANSLVNSVRPWQPAAQHPPQRLEPSPRRAPVGPHNPAG